jgi:peptidoglycan-associated lipoprotein
MKMLIRSTALSLAVGALLAGCGSSVKLDEGAAVTDAKPKAVSGSGTPTPTETGSGVAQSQVTAVDIAKAPTAAGLDRIVYFDFDSFVVKEDFRTMIEGHARVLAASKGKRMVVEGHADERGGREYNLALGQKRAEAVVKSLVLLGAADGQLEAISYGKERPAVDGHDEAAWAKNRRAELKDR